MESQYKGTVVGTMCALYKQPHGAFVLLPDTAPLKAFNDPIVENILRVATPSPLPD